MSHTQPLHGVNVEGALRESPDDEEQRLLEDPPPSDASQQQPVPHSSPFKGQLLMICSELVYSLMAVMVKLVSGQNVPTLWVVFIRSIIVWLICVMNIAVEVHRSPHSRTVQQMMWGSAPDPTVQRNIRLLMFGKGFLGFGSVWSVYFAVTILPLGDAVTLSFTSPLIAAALAAVLLSEKFTFIDGVASLFSMAGVLMVSKPSIIFPNSSETLNPLGVLIALAGAVCAAGTFVVIRKIEKISPVHHLTILQYHEFVISCVSIVVILVSTLINESPPDVHFFGNAKIMGGFVSVGLLAFAGQALLIRSLQVDEAITVTAVKYTQIAWAFVWQLLIFRQKPDLWSVLGALCVGLTAAALTIWKARQRRTVITGSASQ
eukprot:TRINITY_DN28714_c0_g1_i1.p1 TRINITY_DN28714_c0_g1~~TRINITY_DN28714_c0_g1_i1.p1  ORF type:complete len:375 (+),score=72.10 TRINITY_DN28714_c0_g1_i1:85-1209(+)